MRIRRSGSSLETRPSINAFIATSASQRHFRQISIGRLFHRDGIISHFSPDALRLSAAGEVFRVRRNIKPRYPYDGAFRAAAARWRDEESQS